MKTLRFRHDDAIIYDTSRCCGILFGMQNSLVMSYPWANFRCDTIINNISYMYFSCFKIFYFSTKRQRFQHNYIISDIIRCLEIFFNIWGNTTIIRYLCVKFNCNTPTNNENTRDGGRAACQA